MNNHKQIPIIILSGGKGERFIGKENSPKQLSKVSKHPIIIEVMLYYYKNGFNFFILPLGYKKKFFINFFNNKSNIKKYNLNIIKSKKYELSKSKLNIILFNAGINTNKLNRIGKSLKFLDIKNKLFGVCYGDIFANINFKKQLLILKNKKIYAVLASFQERSPYGHLKIDKKKRIINFIEKPIMNNPINIGFYFFKINLFSKYSFGKNDDLETHLLPKLSRKLKLASYMHNKFHFTVNTQKDLIDIDKDSGLKQMKYTIDSIDTVYDRHKLINVRF